MLIRYVKNKPIQIGVFLLILVMAVLDFVMIAELPFFMTSLQIKEEIKNPRQILSFEDKVLDNVHGSAKDQMDRIGGVVDDPVHILYRNLRPNQGLRN